jgi:formate hydrogenlyase subunit 3/multisubunit Na+/H+ antiporter MnhD subunit
MALRTMMSSVGFLVAAAILVGLAGVQWLFAKPAGGELNRAWLGMFFGRRATRRSGWFKTDDRGVYVVQRILAYALLAAAAVCMWIGVLALWID